MSINTGLLARICEAPGASGFEQKIRKLVLDEVVGLVDEVRTDQMGNVVALKKGNSSDRRIMAAAHIDEIGFIVTHIDEKGFIRFNTIGGFDPKTLTSQRVLIHGSQDILGVMGSKPLHIMAPEERSKAVKLKDFFIDTGLPKEQLVEIVQVGNPITRYTELKMMGECVNSKSIDNRVSVFVLLETLRALKVSGENPAYDFYAAFTVQEEVGLRGAQVAALEVKPDFSFGLDTTIAYDVPGAIPQERCTALGGGAGIKLMDSSVICDYRMVAFMKETADKHQIAWQPEILSGGGTDTGSLQRMVPGGSIAGAISVPTRHLHQTIETANVHDIQACIDLLKHCVTELDQGEWSL